MVRIWFVGRSGSRYGDARKGHFSQDLGRLVRGRPFFWPHGCGIQPSGGFVGRSACRFVTQAAGTFRKFGVRKPSADSYDGQVPARPDGWGIRHFFLQGRTGSFHLLVFGAG